MAACLCVAVAILGRTSRPGLRGAAVAVLALGLAIVLIAAIVQFAAGLRERALVSVFALLAGSAVGVLGALAGSFAAAARRGAGGRSPGPPLRQDAAREVRVVCERIGADVEAALRRESGRAAEVGLRSIRYAVEGSERSIEASYRACDDEEVAWHTLRLAMGDRRPRLLPSGARAVSPLADRMIPPLEASARERLASALVWPVRHDAHAALVAEMERLLELYLARLRDALVGESSLSGSILGVEYGSGPDEGEGAITVVFVVESGGEKLFGTSVELSYRDGRFRPHPPSEPVSPPGTARVADPSCKALEAAIEQWRASDGSHPD
jgi:hypothetical protein